MIYFRREGGSSPSHGCLMVKPTVPWTSVLVFPVFNPFNWLIKSWCSCSNFIYSLKNFILSESSFWGFTTEQANGGGVGTELYAREWWASDDPSELWNLVASFSKSYESTSLRSFCLWRNSFKAGYSYLTLYLTLGVFLCFWLRCGERIFDSLISDREGLTLGASKFEFFLSDISTSLSEDIRFSPSFALSFWYLVCHSFDKVSFCLSCLTCVLIIFVLLSQKHLQLQNLDTSGTKVRQLNFKKKRKLQEFFSGSNAW